MQIVLIVVFMNVIIWVFYMPFTPIQQKNDNMKYLCIGLSSFLLI